MENTRTKNNFKRTNYTQTPRYITLGIKCIVVPRQELDTFLKKQYPNSYYNIKFDEDALCGQGNVSYVVNSKKTLTDFDKKQILDFAAGKPSKNVLHNVLQDLVNKDIIAPGKYLVV